MHAFKKGRKVTSVEFLTVPNPGLRALQVILLTPIILPKGLAYPYHPASELRSQTQCREQCSTSTSRAVGRRWVTGDVQKAERHDVVMRCRG